ncbi:MAG TPA: YbgC/FadM family acyl-CoA thioesterase [Nevskiaceae bacterium]|nr:YbgC/FadM family acyl-CoA thioesterase [Nevskiaceae bacterium]
MSSGPAPDPARAVFILALRVYWEDTDASGVVYHANYLRWYERARSEWLAARGLDQERLRVEQGLAFTLAGIEVSYRRPARLGDALRVTVDRIEQGRASLVFEQSIWRGEDCLSRCRARAGCVEAQGFRPRPLPGFFHPGSA